MYAIVVVLMASIMICTANPRTIQRKPDCRFKQDPHLRLHRRRRLRELACHDSRSPEHKALQKTGGLHLLMAALAVIESWLLINTVFTLRYAHVYYRSEQEADVKGPATADLSGGKPD